MSVSIEANEIMLHYYNNELEDLGIKILMLIK